MRKRSGRCGHRRGAVRSAENNTAVRGNGNVGSTSIFRDFVTAGKDLLNGLNRQEKIDLFLRPGCASNQSCENIVSGKESKKGMVAVVDSAQCVGCGLCVEVCPAGAVYQDEKAGIDTMICTGCAICVDKCPRNAITLERR